MWISCYPGSVSQVLPSLPTTWRWIIRRLKLSSTGLFPPQLRRFNVSLASQTSIGGLLRTSAKGGGIKIHWGLEAARAFEELKCRFTSAPILSIPDPERPFVVEVDASEVGVVAILSQRGEDGKLNPCAFMYRRLSDGERNYHVGDLELLAVKLTLEEWRHWLEGVQHPFQVLMDHKNLEYLQQAKRLNPRQARWSLFFNRFQFLLSYRPGTKNVKPDALSRAYSPETQEKPLASIIPRSRIVAPLQWELERVVREAQAQEPDTRGGPVGRVYIPQTTRARVLQWGHESPLTCPPGNARSLDFLQWLFWWPSIKEDVKVYVEACPVCSQGKSTHQRPQGLLHPLPIPRRPWSHLSLDFVTGLPPSQGKHCHPGGCGPVLEGRTVYSPAQITFGQRDSRAHHEPRLPGVWNSPGYCLWPRAPVFVWPC